MLTVNGRIAIRRTRWHEDGVGSCTVIDAYLDRGFQNWLKHAIDE